MWNSAETRGLAKEWTFRFLGAALAELTRQAEAAGERLAGLQGSSGPPWMQASAEGQSAEPESAVRPRR